MDIALLQYDIVWEAPQENYLQIERIVEKAASLKDSLLVLPEMFSSGFSMEKGGHPEDAQFLSKLAQSHDCFVLGGCVEGLGRKRKNVAKVFHSDGQNFSHYEKQRLFTFSGEDQHYTAGQETVVVDMLGAKVAPMICYDLRFPELFRRAAQRGAEVFVVIASWPARRVSHWITLLQARAIENQAYVVGLNRLGKDPWGQYPGRSLVVDPQGVIVSDASDREGLLRVSLDLDALRKWRQEFPALKDHLAWEQDPSR